MEIYKYVAVSLQTLAGAARWLAVSLAVISVLFSSCQVTGEKGASRSIDNSSCDLGPGSFLTANMPEENVKVAIRVRPFNKRELSRSAQCILEVEGQTTFITNPADPNDRKKFTFDHSYWSHDGYKEVGDGYFEPDPSHPNFNKFCDQKKIYQDLGQGILKNAWDGYNSTLFAYGQTGSGKSWSIIGYGANKGIVPLFCAEVFTGIRDKKSAGDRTDFEVKFSMLEIYNEVVRDLLDLKKSKKGLKVREHPKRGFYPEGLKSALVASYEDIQQRMDEGTINRTVASTNMNSTSSRAHTIVGITFIQKGLNDKGEETAKVAIINLVDLAGSERVDTAGTSGERLKEGAAINQSLSCLGNCIHALAEKSGGKKIRVPYRDSVLTKLLMNALGGNSKTFMVAAVSPADLNYDESLSTLRYADRAKQIKTKAVVNQDPTEKLIRELKEENDKLKKMLSTGEVDLAVLGVDVNRKMSDQELQELRRSWQEETKAHMRANEDEMRDMITSYEERLRLARLENAEPWLKKIEEERKTKPHIYNLNFDPLLSGRLVHILHTGTTDVGNRKGKEMDIVMLGPGMQQQHASFSINDRDNSIRPFNRDCRVLVNGSLIQGETPLQHNDRLVFGSTQIWVFQNPREYEPKRHYPFITYAFAQEEIAAKAGIYTTSGDMSLLQEDLLAVMPAVEEANTISEELDKHVKFEIVLVSAQMMSQFSSLMEHDPTYGTVKPGVCVKMKDLQNGTEFLWPKDKFLNRFYRMKEMYNKFEDNDDWEVPEDEDPFQESADTEVLVGTVQVFVQPLAYMVELKEELEITNLKGQSVGFMNIEVAPCDARGKEYTEADDKFVDSPDMLIGRDVHFLFKIHNCRGIPKKYTDMNCKYRMYVDENETTTKKVSLTSNPDFNHQKMFSFTPATAQLVDYLNNGSVMIQLMGKQHVRKSARPQTKGLNTRELLRADRGIFSRTANLMNGFQMNGRVVDPQKQSIIVELLLMKKTQARLQQKVDGVKKLLERADSMQKRRVSTDVVKSVLNASTPEQSEKVLKMLEGEPLDDDDDEESDIPGRHAGKSSSNVCSTM